LTTIYFSHYYFEACRLVRRADKLFERLGVWFELEAKGFKTTFETPGNTRSDCHAWGAHPIYHCFAAVAGIRPASFGFEDVEIAPLPGALDRIGAKLVHPLGEIKVELKHKGNSLKGTVFLPKGLSGSFIWNGSKKILFSGEQNISF
jgi:hypothetical protein